jgi:hypothetical protein
VLEALRYCGYSTDDRVVQSGLTLLRHLVDQDWPDRSSFWYGAGFHGAAMTVFNAYGDAEYANRVYEQVWRYWDEELGCFQRPRDSRDSQRAPAEWHTASALLGLKSFGSVSPRPDSVDRAFDWLRSQQQDGCWSPGHLEISCYATKQAVLALASSGYANNHIAAAAGTDWLIRQAAADGRLSVRLMAASAIARTHGAELVASVPYEFVQEITDLLRTYRELSRNLLSLTTDLQARWEGTAFELRTRTAELKEEKRRYIIRITERQLAIWSVLLTLVTVGIGVVIALVQG